MSISRVFKHLLTFFVLSLLSLSAVATTFIETPIEDRLKQASGVVKGTFLGKVYKKLPTGRVVTEVTIKVDAFSGLQQNEIINHNNFKVIYPGGVWQNRVYKVHGAPSFKPNEVVVVVVKEGDFGYIVPDLALSKFSLIKRDQKTYLQSEIFSDKKGIGLIDIQEFNSLTEKNFGTKLEKLIVDKYVDKNIPGQKGTSRKPASSNRNATSDEEDSTPVIWFVLGLGLLGFISTLLVRGKGNEG